jgi:hypothetical protein
MFEFDRNYTVLEFLRGHIEHRDARRRENQTDALSTADKLSTNRTANMSLFVPLLGLVEL